MPSPNLQFSSPWHLLFHSTPDYFFLKTFGCLCFPLLCPYNKHKLEPRSSPCVFLGYALYAKGYLCLNLKSLKFIVSHHVVFNENKFPFSQSSSIPSSSSYPSTNWLSSVLYFHPYTAPSILGPPPSTNTIPNLPNTYSNYIPTPTPSTSHFSPLIPTSVTTPISPAPTICPV